MRGAILAEFQGRCPTIREVSSISDAEWLTVPNIGPTTLEELRKLALSAPSPEEPQGMPGMADGELLSRLNRLQRELNIVAGEIRSRIAEPSQRRRPEK